MINFIVFLPLIGFFYCSLLGHYTSDRQAQFFSTLLLFISAIFSWIIFIEYLFGKETEIVYLINCASPYVPS